MARLVCLFVAVAAVLICVARGATEATTVNALRDAMTWFAWEGGTCVLRFSETGPVGCAVREDPEVGRVVAPIESVPSLPHTVRSEEPIAALVDDATLAPLLRILASYASDPSSLSAADAALASHITAVLVLTNASNSAASSSPAAPEPLAASTVAAALPTDADVNPAGQDLLNTFFGVPVVRLGLASGPQAQALESQNHAKGYRGELQVADISMPMGPSPSLNASRCLAADLCDPVGGHSVAAALPGPSAGSLPTLLVTAAMDARTLWYNAPGGAEAMSGAYVLMAAAAAVGAALKNTPAASFQRRVVFAALSGEMWGRLGSQRLAEEMAAQGPAALDVPVSDLWALMDIGMAGLPTHASNGAAQFAAHVPPTSATSLAQPSAVLAALNAHATGGGGGVTLTTAEGLPSLSAAHAFLSNPAFASVPALHLSDYASRLRYDAFASSYDSACPGDCFVYGTDRTVLGYSGLPATVDLDYDAMGALACTVAKAVVDLVAPNAGVTVDCGQAGTVAKQAAACLTLGIYSSVCQPLAQSLLDPIFTEPGVVGVLGYEADKAYIATHGMEAYTQSPYMKADGVRLVWNYFGSVLGQGTGQQCDQAGVHPCGEGQACIGWLSNQAYPDGAGQCYTVSLAYVPAYSSRLSFNDQTGRWSVGAGNGTVYAEARWPVNPSTELYLRSDRATELGSLLGGLALFIVCLAVTYYGERVAAKAGAHLLPL